MFKDMFETIFKFLIDAKVKDSTGGMDYLFNINSIAKVSRCSFYQAIFIEIYQLPRLSLMLLVQCLF